jgi:flagellar motility protein MotE (MotC chaperone)
MKNMQPRLIPVTIFILSLALADRAFDTLGISWVQSSKASAPKAEEKKEEATADAHGGESKEEKKKVEKPKFSTVRPAEKIVEFTRGEKEILEKLSDRRAELEKWQNDLEIKEKLVAVSSQKLDEKITELKQIQADTDILLRSYNEQENAKLRSLVKIYEAMKPKDAAAIFNEMDMDITLDLVDMMAEKKASPIMAAMDTKRARKITEELALRRSLKEAAAKRNVAAAKDIADASAVNTLAVPGSAPVAAVPAPQTENVAQ